MAAAPMPHRRARAVRLTAPAQRQYMIALVLRCAQHAPKQIAKYSGKRRCGPVHPAIAQRALGRRVWIQRRRVLGGQVAHDRIGFPQHQRTILQGRHHTIRVQRAIRRRVVAAECAADFDRGIGHAGFFGAPQHLAHIAGIAPAPQCDSSRRCGGQTYVLRHAQLPATGLAGARAERLAAAGRAVAAVGCAGLPRPPLGESRTHKACSSCLISNKPIARTRSLSLR